MSGAAPHFSPLRVVLVEDSPRLCRLLAGILGELDGVAVVGEAADEPSALRVLSECEADLAIVDLELGGELTVVEQNLDSTSMDALAAGGRPVRLLWKREHSQAIRAQ